MLLDSNIIIYASKPENSFLLDLISKQTPSVSVISKIEVLGYHLLSGFEKKIFEGFFEAVEVVELQKNIVETAIELRKKHKLTLGDSIIAATAIENNLVLVTRNEKDFKGIKKLKLVNPFKN